ncbi:MAG: hypothetical protein AAF698_00530, partial [Pseudomonadota bacterium]
LLVPRAVRVELADEWRQIDAWTLRRVVTDADLREGDGLILNPQPSDEGGVRVGAREYAFRPGDVVRVGLDADLPAEGFWLPNAALVPRTGNHLVFTVENGVAREVLVDVLESSGDKRRVDAPALEAGAAVVVRGMQYLTDGQPVVSQAATTRGTP